MPQDPLADLQILDFSQGAAAPFAATLFADHGADVISVEPPGGAGQRTVTGRPPNVMRNKRSIVVDLKANGATEVITDLVEDADILIENNRPGVMERLGLDYEALKAHNDGLIYCSITGYGQTGPDSDRPAFDPIAQAVSGLMWSTGEPDRKPSRVGASVVDLGTGLSAAYACFVALWERENTGEGTHLDVSLLDTAVGVYMAKWISKYSSDGTQPQRLGHSTSYYAPAGVFETDTDPIYLAVPFGGLWDRFCDALGRTDWDDDPRFATEDARVDNREALEAAITEEFANHSAGALLERLLHAGVPASELNTVADVVENEHVRQRGILQRVPDLNGEEVLAGSNPARLSGEPAPLGRPPDVGEHTDEVLEAAGYTEEDVRALRESGIVE